jgi:hypothetical protein
MQQKGCSGKKPDTEGPHTETLAEERTDSSGNRWRKVYTGGGSHFRHWLEQFKEIYEEENILVEEEDPAGFACFEQAGEKMYSVWLKLS